MEQRTGRVWVLPAHRRQACLPEDPGAEDLLARGGQGGLRPAGVRGYFNGNILKLSCHINTPFTVLYNYKTFSVTNELKEPPLDMLTHL